MIWTARAGEFFDNIKAFNKRREKYEIKFNYT